MKKVFATAFLFLGMTAAVAQVKVALNSKVFIAPMSENLHGFVASEIIKQKLPLLVVQEEKYADFVLVGVSMTKESKWFEVAFAGKGDTTQGNVQLLEAKSQTLVWAAATGNKGSSWGKSGQQRVAAKLVKKMKKELFKQDKKNKEQS